MPWSATSAATDSTEPPDQHGSASAFRHSFIPKDRSLPINSADFAKLIAKAIDNKQGTGIRAIDVRGVSSLSDYVVVDSAASAPQRRAIQNEVERDVKKSCPKATMRLSGDVESAWIVLDYFDVIVHLFLPEAREYYDIESLWKKGKDLALEF